VDDTDRTLASLVIGINAFSSSIEENYTPSWSHTDSGYRRRNRDYTGSRRYRYPAVDCDDDTHDKLTPANNAIRLNRAPVLADAPVCAMYAESTHGIPKASPTPHGSSKGAWPAV